MYQLNPKSLNIISITYFSCHENLSRSDLGDVRTLNHNGPAVWLVGVRVAVPRFLPVLVDGGEFWVTIKLSRQYEVQVDGSEVLCHDETVKVASKKQGTRASAASPIDSVLVAGLVKVYKIY